MYFFGPDVFLSPAILVCIGLLSGVASGIFGVGGGFISTPLLILSGVPSYISVATSSNQIIGSSVSAAIMRHRDNFIDYKLGFFIAIFGIFGAICGTFAMKILNQYGSTDVLTSIFYIVLMSTISYSMIKGFFTKNDQKTYSGKSIFKHLPFKIHFRSCLTKVSIFSIFIAGIIVGLLVSIMGIGGGFVLIPILCYYFGVPYYIASGTSLFQMIFVTAATIILYSFQQNVFDVSISVFLTIGSSIGAVIGSVISKKTSEKHTKLWLGVIMIFIALKFILSLVLYPDEMFLLDVE